MFGRRLDGWRGEKMIGRRGDCIVGGEDWMEGRLGWHVYVEKLLACDVHIAHCIASVKHHKIQMAVRISTILVTF